jgi:multidrug efflux pump
MRFTDLFIRQPILAVVVSLAILLAGTAAFFGLSVQQYPSLQSATITIDTDFPGATQEVMQGFVTTPIAQSIATASGIDYLASTSIQGHSQIKAKLVLNADIDRAMAEVLAKVQQVKYRLPQGAFDPVIAKITDGASGVQYISFKSSRLSIPEITDFVSRVAQPMLTSIPGVASANIGGGQTMAMRVWIDPDKLAARGLTAGDVATALRANNVQAAPGQLRGGGTLTNITASTDLRDVEDFRTMIIRKGRDGLVRLGDIATIEIGGENYNTQSRDDGERVVSIAIMPTPDGNPLAIVRASMARLAEIRKAAPAGLQVKSTFDVGHFVDAAIREVEHTLIEAIGIVVIVIFLFLGSMRAVVIPVITIPLSIIGTGALMLAFGFSINLLTLLAMVLAIGLVVDDAIVVVENIHRHIEEGRSPLEAALIGAHEIVGPIIAMTITLAAVYAPIGFMGGLTGSLFREFAFTLAGAVVVSGAIALTLSPMMSSRLLAPKASEGRFAKAVEHRFELLAHSYRRAVELTLENRPVVLLLAAAILVAIFILFFGSRRELAPQEDQGYIFTTVRAPQYASVEYTTRATRKVDAIFKSLNEFENSWFSDGTDGQNNAFGGVVFKDWGSRQRTANDIQNMLYGAVSPIHEAYITPFQPTPLPAASGNGLPFQMVLRSPADFSGIYQQMETLKQAAWRSGLFAFVDSDLAFDSPATHLAVDTAKAGDMGVSMQAIADTLAILVGENYVNRFNYFERSYEVIPQVREADRLNPENLGRYYVRTGSGSMVPLSTLIRIENRSQPNRLPQFNQMNAATLSAVLRPGATMGEAVSFLKAQPLSPGMQIDWTADSRQYVMEGNRLTISFGLALVVIFLVLAAQYGSFRDPIVILITVPLAVCGALLPLYLGYTTLNIYTQIGLVTLIGLISKHGILMVAFANQIQHGKGLNRRAAILEAAAVRMRPILMTTAAMVTGLLPLLFAGGAGASSRFAIGVVVVMGMVVGTGFTLFVLPTFYDLLARDHRVHHQDAPGASGAPLVEPSPAEL